MPAHFRELAEITITRRYFRSGESEYFINKTACRLKDITELFLGTGVGSKAYAIIEQGRVEQLINAKPEDRRLFIEEAAGTTLYRSRKLQAERKMERTRENLLRVNDVLRELERQIQYLHRMAKKAEQYRALQEEIRQLDLALCGAQWRQLTAAVAELDAEIAGQRERERQLVEELTRLEQRTHARRWRHSRRPRRRWRASARPPRSSNPSAPVCGNASSCSVRKSASVNAASAACTRKARRSASSKTRSTRRFVPPTPSAPTVRSCCSPTRPS